MKESEIKLRMCKTTKKKGNLFLKASEVKKKELVFS